MLKYLKFAIIHYFIMEYENLVLIGSSHIARESIEEVRNTVNKYKPDIIALELDRKRMYSLVNKKQDKIRIYDIFRVGIKGFFFALLGKWAEEKLGKLVGVSPGSEMEEAIKLAKKSKIKIALIDQDIEVTLRKFSKAITWKEKFRFVADIIRAVIPWTRKKVINFDLTKVPDEKIINKLIKEVKDRYPNVYRILVKQRNNIMAHNLSLLMEKNNDKRILAVVGAGHEKDILDLLKKEKDGKITYSFSVS